MILPVERVDPLLVPQLPWKGRFVFLAVTQSNFCPTSTQAGKNSLVDPCLVQPSST